MATVLFIKSDAEVATFLTQITFSGGIHNMGMFAFSFYDLTYLICDNISCYIGWGSNYVPAIAPTLRAHNPAALANVLYKLCLDL